MTATDPGAIVTATFADFGGFLTSSAPGLLAIGLIAFGVPFVFRWAKRLVS
ncbi:MAG: hypothetical protein K0S37_3668 [Microbacterium sp.]|nr:hypothetical protein [Microbacterium sp.]